MPNTQRELIVEFAGDDFVGGLRDQLGLVGGKLAQILIDQRAGFFQNAEGADQFGRHGVAPDVEVQQRTLRLRAPIDVGWDFDLAHAVGFDADVCVDGGGGDSGGVFGNRSHEISCASDRKR